MTAGSTLILLILLAAPARAAVCDVSPLGVAFGTYDTLDPTAVEGVGNLAIRCDAEVSYTIMLSRGSGDFAERRMTSNTAVLTYNLYLDPSRLGIRGDGTAGTSVVTGTAASADHAIYGRLPAEQNVPAGAYSDTITVTVVY